MLKELDELEMLDAVDGYQENNKVVNKNTNKNKDKNQNFDSMINELTM